MKTIFLIAGLLTAASAKSLKLDFWKNKTPVTPQKSTLSRRSHDFADPLTGDYYHVQYFINVTIGTPAQPFSLQLDTGSSDTWVPSADSESCQDDGCSDYGAFNKNVSSTYSLVPGQEGTFSITYGDSSYAAGDYFTDVLSFGSDASLTNVTMANANDTDLYQGLMGVGFQANEASLQNADPFSFPTVPELLKAQGLIDRVAYSLYLDSYEDDTGSILFGGIDPSRYTGELLALPLSTDLYGNYSEFRIALTGISIHDGKSTRALTLPKFSVPALLDSGTTDSILPQEVTDAITKGLGATTDDDSGYAYVPCSYRKSNASLIYTFGGLDGVNVSVPLSEIIGEQLGDESAYSNGVPACSLNIDGGGEDESAGGTILGDSFLRSAYVVYDLDNLVVAIAQAKLGQKSPEDSAAVTPIPSGTALPGVTRTATVTATPTPTDSSAPYSASLGLPVTPTFNLPGVTATSTAKAEAQSNAAGGTGLASGFGVVMAAGIIILQVAS